MRGTNILVCSLPADPVGDQRVREAVKGKGGEKGGAYEPCNLYTHLFVCVCAETFTLISSLSNGEERRGPSDQRSERICFEGHWFHSSPTG